MVKNHKFKDKDKLDYLFKMQELFQKKLKNIPFRNLKHQQEFINITLLACFDELGEAMRETLWKNPNYISGGWKATSEFNKEKFKEEIIDLWHFVINLSISSGMDSGELFNRFLDKNKLNHSRQDNNY